MLGRLLPRSSGAHTHAPALLHSVAPNAAPMVAQAARAFASSARPLLNEAAPAAAAAAADAGAADAGAASASARPVSTRAFTNATLRRQALAQANPWYISHSALRRLRHGGFDGPVKTALPHELRAHKPDFEMRRLRHLEATKLAADPKRVICDFKAGDRIVVSKYVSLNDRTRFDRIAGLVLARFKGDRLTASFIMRAHKLGEDYELRFPLWSPFIGRIDLVEPAPELMESRRAKLYHLREGERATWETKVPHGLPKPTAEPQSIDHRAKQSGGKIQILNFAPMKKKVLERRAGGIGAEMAAAGGADKGKKK